MDIGNLPMKYSFICKTGRVSTKRGCQGLGGGGKIRKKGDREKIMSKDREDIFELISWKMRRL